MSRRRSFRSPTCSCRRARAVSCITGSVSIVIAPALMGLLTVSDRHERAVRVQRARDHDAPRQHPLRRMGTPRLAQSQRHGIGMSALKPIPAVAHLACQHNASHRGLRERTDPPMRGMVLARGFFAGSQRYGPIWQGDNLCTWEHLAVSVPMMLSNGIAGMAFNGRARSPSRPRANADCGR